jgi:hypothetical protein
MKQFLILFFLIFVMLPPAAVPYEIDRPFIAVYCNSDERFLDEWVDDNRPNLLFKAKDWSDFPEFLTQVKVKAAGRPIILDIDTHGDERGLLWLSYWKVTFIDKDSVKVQQVHYFSNFGYIFNKIDEILPPGELREIDSEACFAGEAFDAEKTKHDELNFSGNIVENCRKPLPPNYGVYGVTNHYNLANATYLQRQKYREDIAIIDLRDLNLMEIEKPNKDVLNPKVLTLLAWLISHGEVSL